MDGSIVSDLSQRVTFKARSTENLELRTSNIRVSLVSPFPRVSRVKIDFAQTGRALL